MLERFFQLKENGTTISRELLAGLTTFLTMAYIIFVQPSVLSGQMFGMQTGLDFGAVLSATCFSAAIATLIMGLYARYPVALAPGMGENFFFVFGLLPAAAALPAVQAGGAVAWQVGLGVVLISGLLFFALSLAGVREKVIDAVSPSLKSAIAAGIGLFIAFIGLQNAGVIVANPGTLVKLNVHFESADSLVFFAGLLLTGVLLARGWRGAVLWGILGATLLAVVLHEVCAGHFAESRLMTQFKLAEAVFSAPPAISPTLFKADLTHALTGAMVPFIFVFLFMDFFDTIGTLIGVSEKAGLLQNNRLPRARQALLADATGTVVGAGLGTSTVTSFIESAAGVSYGGRTGLTAVAAAGLFLLAPFFAPVVSMVASYPPITAPTLVIVGSLMMTSVRKIEWDDASEAVPAFLILLGIPLSYSIADGLALGFIAYPVVKLGAGKVRECGWLSVVLGAVLLAYFILVRAKLG